MRKTGAQILLECLKREGVEVIFGYPGGAILPLVDELPNWGFRNILVRHEQAAVHAADGYARASGKVGVCLVTSGPGATNTVTGIATAYMDSIPVVVFTGQVPVHLIGNDAFQEADIVGITRPCTKHNYLVTDVKKLARIVREAFYIARSGRPGPVLVDLPKNVLTDTTEFRYPEKVEIRGYQPTLDGHIPQIERAARLILKSRRPLIYAGGGVISSGASEELRELAEFLQIPVTTTLMGLGGFPGTHPLFLGMLGMHGTYRANMAVTHCDLLIAIGARFDDRVTGKVDEFSPHSKKIHIDIDPTSISKNVRVDIPIVGDCKRVLRRLLEALKEEKPDREVYREGLLPWYEKIEEWKERDKLAYNQNLRIKPQFVVEKIYELTKGEAIISSEVGQNQMWTAQYYRFDRPRTFLTSGGLGTMGYGFPAAIGAQVAFPDRLVIDIAGDGSIQMNIQELATAVQHRLPVKVAILNNGYLGMVRQWQELFYEKKYVLTQIGQWNPDFVKLAEAYGAVGLRATRPEEVEPVIREAFRTPLPVLMDFVVEAEESVYPMVPAGEPISKMLLV
ncbi:MAG: biosynthetic-type acetolactate synthase large subunit [Deltaproteobacteria bacterium]|nr:MAG: biosynthetic-type acetolactate synthase large subunit [Deltaproteobacteria bacterium]